MLRTYCIRFAVLALAGSAPVSCGNDSAAVGAPAFSEGQPGASDNVAGAGGNGSAPAGSGVAPPLKGEAAPGESPNAGLGNAPIVDASTGASASGEPAGDAADASSVGGSASVGGAGGAGGATSMGSGGGSSVFPVGVTRPRIMIVGDSVSAGPGCYKKYLLADLNANGYSNFDFVGEYADSCAGGSVRNSAVSCSTAEQYTQPTFTMPNCSPGMSFPGMPTLVTTHRPDLVMLQLGVNDVWNARSPDAILANYATLVRQARAQNPNVVIAVAQIQQIRPGCGDDDSVMRRAEELVNAVPAWARAQSQPQSPVFVANLWTNSDWTMAQTIDCVHPNDIGAQRMGLNWFNTLKGILSPD